MPDLQAAWLLLLYCAVPRANHLIRALPPDVVADYARAHDEGIWATFLDLIGYAPGPARSHARASDLPIDRASAEKGSGKGSSSQRQSQLEVASRSPLDSESDDVPADSEPLPELSGGGGRGAAQRSERHPPNVGPDPAVDAARQIAFLPIVMGGLGLRSMTLLSPAAYWAAWADILPIIAERVPALGDRVLQELERGGSLIPCVAQVEAAEGVVANPSFALKPTWRELVEGARPPERSASDDDEPGQWPHGW